MSPISRGFGGHRPHVDAARVPPGQHVVDEFPVLSVGATPRSQVDVQWTIQLSGGRRTGLMDLGGAARAPRGDAEARHPLRDEMVEARHDVEGRFGRHAARPSGDRGGIRKRLVRRRLPDQPSAGRRDRWAGVDRLRVRPGTRSTPSTAARPGSSSRTCTSGRAPSGSEDSSSSSRTDRGSGRPPATTTTAIRGGSSAMTATETSTSRPRAKETP
jgi:hypothetical protein